MRATTAVPGQGGAVASASDNRRNATHDPVPAPTKCKNQVSRHISASRVAPVAQIDVVCREQVRLGGGSISWERGDESQPLLIWKNLIGPLARLEPDKRVVENVTLTLVLKPACSVLYPQRSETLARTCAREPHLLRTGCALLVRGKAGV